MKKTVLTALICLIAAASTAVIVETGSLRNFLVGSEPACAYDNWISHMAEGIVVNNYNLYAPYDPQTNGFGDFNLPDGDELAYWGFMLDLFCAGDYEGAQTVLTTNEAPFQIVEFNDTDSGRTYYMVREIPNTSYYDDNNTIDPADDEFGAFTYGWGLYIYNPAGTKPAIVTVPHPCDDFPTPIIGYEAFDTWNAKYLMINGSGREVRWTNEGNYTNSKSLSDPTRNINHPLQLAYTKFADKIRDEEGWREFSAQMHTYDWNRHVGYPNCQISAGNPRMCPNLPIRDLSPLKHDLLNAGQHLMIPANTVGIHEDVFHRDFYSVNYDTHEFIFDDGEQSYPVNDHIDLPAYTQNRQMLYTQLGTTDYDTYEPFFHIEMDELPNSYEETTTLYHWFYGWNEAEEVWDMENLFTHFVDYYSRWIDDMEPVLAEMFNMNDGMTPTPPTELTVLNQSLNNVTLSWNRSSDYDFDSYEVLYATEPIMLDNYEVFDRSNNAYLASQAAESITVTNLDNASQYYFQIRAKDKNGNVSVVSNEVNTILAPANVTNLYAHGLDGTVRVYWQVNGQYNNQGFNVYRKQADGDYALVDSWQTNPDLIDPTAYSFEWWDDDVTNGEYYTYKVSSTNLDNIEFFYNFPAPASPQAIHFLTIRNTASTLADTISFGINPQASDGNDYYWDTSKGGPSSTPYVWNAFWEQYWGNQGTHLSREIKGFYDLDTQIKTWIMRTRSDQIGETLFIEASDTFGRSEKLYLQDGGNYHDLTSGPYQFTNINSNIRTMTLHWGDLQPKVLLSSQPNKLFQGGSSLNLSWNFQYPFLIDHIELSIQNATDSLLVNSWLPNNMFSYSWLIPSFVTEMQDCRVAADVVALDGTRTRFWSTYRFSLLPSMNMAFNEAGWKTRVNPWLNSDLSFEDVFGAGTLGFESNLMGGWQETTDYDFGNAYWVYSPDINFYSNTLPIQSDELSYALAPGWNFIPNPHLCGYDLDNISFNFDGQTYRFGEMLSQQLISRAVYVMRGGSYRPTERIEPWEALLIKYYGTPGMNAQIRFYPFFEAHSVVPPAANWEGLLGASQNGDIAHLNFGMHPQSTDGYDFWYDLPAPPVPPYDRHAMWFVPSGPDCPESALFSDFKADFTSPEEQRSWDFQLEVFDTAPVSFTFGQWDIPGGWNVVMTLDGHSYQLFGNDRFDFVPPEAGTYDGSILVSNHAVGADDPVRPPINAFNAYPNPFNPDVKISFNLARAGKVRLDVYNLRGQKVKSLLNDDLSAGTHSLMWDGKDRSGRGVASGVYFARVNAGDKTLAIKMMLMK